MADPNDLRSILVSIGLDQYTERFIAEGFDTWQTVADITESDLDYLKVKLGHRRKLQRAIADSRDFSRNAALPPQLTTELSGSSDGVNHDPNARYAPGPEQDAQARAKRKYRRHPKPDANAPVKPPSAYVVFSNKTRDELKEQNLSFTDMAKIVGAKWQALPAAKREAFEQEAATDKEAFHAAMAEYRKTDQWQEYNEYLKKFKESQSNQSQQGKRPKLASETSEADGVDHDYNRGSRSVSRDEDRLYDHYHGSRTPTSHYPPEKPPLALYNTYPSNSPSSKSPEFQRESIKHHASYPGAAPQRHDPFHPSYSPIEPYSSHLRSQLPVPGTLSKLQPQPILTRPDVLPQISQPRRYDDTSSPRESAGSYSRPISAPKQERPNSPIRVLPPITAITGLTPVESTTPVTLEHRSPPHHWRATVKVDGQIDGLSDGDRSSGTASAVSREETTHGRTLRDRQRW